MAESRHRDPQIDGVRTGIRDYYTSKVQRYGATPMGVDWRCVPTQQLRFVQLMKLCAGDRGFALDDLGCGYGALLTYLAEWHPAADIDYLGIDLSPAMLRRARRLWREQPSARFVLGHASPRIADYCVASGIFNVKLEQPRERWERFVAETLADMAAGVRRGFAVNLMLPVSVADERQSLLYRSPAERWVGYCKRELGLTVTLVKGYGLREYTLLARK